MPAKTVVKKPQLSKEDKAYLSLIDGLDSTYGKLIAERVIQQMDQRADEFKWRGYISPSNKISLRMCIETLFKNAQKPFKVSPKTLVQSIFYGRIVHSGLFAEAEKVPQLLFPKPVFPSVSVENWYNKVAPEIPIDDGYFRAIVDQVLAEPVSEGYEFPDDLEWTLDNVRGLFEPVVMDLKTIGLHPSKGWKEFKKKGKPKPSHLAQVCIYICLMERYGYYPGFKFRKGEVLYLNTKMPWLSPGSLFAARFEYEPYREMTEELVDAAIKQLIRFREGKRVYCDRRFCTEHG